MNLLDQFYADQVDKPETYEIEKKALIDQYEPKINIEIINGGLFTLPRQSKYLVASFPLKQHDE